MSPVELLATCRQAGILLATDGGDLVVDAPRGVLTPELRATLVAQKPALLDLLRPRFVTLKGGLTLPIAAFELALDLERRGIPLATDRDHHFLVPDDARLMAEDRAAIGRWQQYLGAIVEYDPLEVQ